jgi:hypothetical protein
MKDAMMTLAAMPAMPPPLGARCSSKAALPRAA